MATLISTIISDARIKLKETSASYWTDAELLSDLQRGAMDLWGAIIDLNEEHYMTVDITTMSIAAEATTVTGVPADVFRVLLIEPRDTTEASSTGGVLFRPKNYNSPEAIAARAQNSDEPTGGLVIYYSLAGQGSPIAAPTIHVAPKINSALNLRVAYVPGIAASALASGVSNPIPGESDTALLAWTIAYARAKEREDRSPDPSWLAIYATEKQNLLTRMTPRQTQEPEVVDDFFGEIY